LGRIFIIDKRGGKKKKKEESEFERKKASG